MKVMYSYRFQSYENNISLNFNRIDENTFIHKTPNVWI